MRHTKPGSSPSLALQQRSELHRRRNTDAGLYDLVTTSAAPLRSVESTFAVGSTGFGTTRVNVRIPGRSPDSTAWRWLWHMYNLRRDDFLALYHARSNAESTFSSMKRVFGDTLRSRGRVAQTNELLLKVIVHNIVCLVHSMFELGVETPTFACTNKLAQAQQIGA